MRREVYPPTKGVILVLRFGYVLESVHPDQDGEWELARKQVDPDGTDPERLRAELEPWAVSELARLRCEFGLYTAEFGAWNARGRPSYYARNLYLIWGGEDLIATHVEDSPVNFAGVRALATQAEAHSAVMSPDRGVTAVSLSGPSPGRPGGAGR
ncbi:hypothetical protein GCM10025787_49630 [Saccharopolyspora rosea]